MGVGFDETITSHLLFARELLLGLGLGWPRLEQYPFLLLLLLRIVGSLHTSNGPHFEHTPTPGGGT
jgi:hypothetical protein